MWTARKADRYIRRVGEGKGRGNRRGRGRWKAEIEKEIM